LKVTHEVSREVSIIILKYIQTSQVLKTCEVFFIEINLDVVKLVELTKFTSQA